MGKYESDVAMDNMKVKDSNTLTLPDGYEIFGEVDIEKIKSALETYADRVTHVG